MGIWISRLIDKLEVKELWHIHCHNSQIQICKCFPEADTLSAQKGTKSHSFAFFAIRCQRKWVLGVKPFWQELMRSLPLILVEMQALDVDLDDFSSPDQVLANCCILSESWRGRMGNWWHISKTFIKNMTKIGHILALTTGDLTLQQSKSICGIKDLGIILLAKIVELVPNLRQALWCRGEMSDDRLRGILSGRCCCEEEISKFINYKFVGENFRGLEKEG